MDFFKLKIIIIKLLKNIGRIFLFLLLGLLIINTVEYAVCPIYDFPDAVPFQGNDWFNPYEQPNECWFKANFHAHSRCYFGLTNGQDQLEDVIDHYRSLGYDIISISNYQQISIADKSLQSFIPVYEHGYNIKKNHQIIIGAGKVSWSDYVVQQNIHNKQHILDILQKKNEFVAIAHPALNSAYSPDDMTRLTNYDAVEVLNHYVQSEHLWDYALSAGRIVWIIGDDDTHNIQNSCETGVCWTMINSVSCNREDILYALKNGKMYGVSGNNGLLDNELKSVEIRNDTLSVEVEKNAIEIRFIGQNGILRKTDPNTRHATLLLKQEDTYIRTEIENGESTFYLNPVLRYDGKGLPVYYARINMLKTWRLRTILFVIFSCIFCLGMAIRKKLVRK